LTERSFSMIGSIGINTKRPRLTPWAMATSPVTATAQGPWRCAVIIRPCRRRSPPGRRPAAPPAASCGRRRR
jgi:hypothetical protein